MLRIHGQVLTWFNEEQETNDLVVCRIKNKFSLSRCTGPMFSCPLFAPTIYSRKKKKKKEYKEAKNQSQKVLGMEDNRVGSLGMSAYLCRRITIGSKSACVYVCGAWRERERERERER